jgi:hypothetical protein
MSELNERVGEMPSHPVANTPMAVATHYMTTCKGYDPILKPSTRGPRQFIWQKSANLPVKQQVGGRVPCATASPIGDIADRRSSKTTRCWLARLLPEAARIDQDNVLVVTLCYHHNMNTEAETTSIPSHPLGPLASLAALAQEQSDILTAVAHHAQRMDAVTLKRLARLGALPGVRDYSLLWALLPTKPAPVPEQEICVDSTNGKG